MQQSLFSQVLNVIGQQKFLMRIQNEDF